MGCTDCFRSLFTVFLVLVNSLLALCSLAVIGLAIYGVVLQQSLSSASAIFLWIMLAAGIIMFLTALMGCCGARSDSKGWLCCYSFLLLIAFVVSIVYLSFAWTAVYALQGATACNFNPGSAMGSDCESYEGAMNVTFIGYLAQAQACDLDCSGDSSNPLSVSCKCQNGDSWFTSVVNSKCPDYPVQANPVAGLADFVGCGVAFAEVVSDSDLTQDEVVEAASWGGYFCACPARFADAYDGVFRATIIPGMIQGGLVALLVLSACCLMCIPSQRKVLVSRYYAQQATV